MGLVGPIDLRCAAVGGGEHRGAGFAGYVEDGELGPQPWPADGGSPAELRRWPCVPWWPAAGSLELAELLAEQEGGWRGMVRCVLAGPGAEAALAEWAIGPLASALADACIPLALDLSPTVDLGAVFSLAVAHPTLSILLRIERGTDPDLAFALLAAAPNVLIETSGLEREDIAAAIAIDPTRVAFGSGFPANDPATELARVGAAAGEEGLFAQVAGGNALRILDATEKDRR